MKKTRLE
nr:cytochrome b6/f complex subunit IV [Viscum articulatum]QPP20734.1 cytochrome b6/f complex subunit IV [Viscum articulatum]